MNDEKLKSIGFYLRQIHRIQKANINKNILEKKLEVTYEQAWLIMVLYKNDGINQQEIANRCFKEKSTILRLIDSLEKKNLVYREKDELDRRNNRIFITEEGKIIQKELMRIHIDMLYELFDGFDDDVIDRTEEIVFQIYNKLKQNNHQLNEEISYCEGGCDAN